jgi:alkyl hydroperoxide reductase subunit AhpC
MALQIGDVAPNFAADTTKGRINFHEWLGEKWGMLLSHPADFTPVCTTELGALARLKNDFARRRVKVIGLSVDTLESHHEWIRDINETQRVNVEFPIIADPERRVADLYGMLYGVTYREEVGNATVRSLFIIGPDKSVRLIISYPESTGRNFQEILRAIDSLQVAEKHELWTPANWKPGEDCLIPGDVGAEQLAGRFPEGYMEVKPYLRYAPQPSRLG